MDAVRRFVACLKSEFARTLATMSVPSNNLDGSESGYSGEPLFARETRYLRLGQSLAQSAEFGPLYEAALAEGITNVIVVQGIEAARKARGDLIAGLLSGLDRQINAPLMAFQSTVFDLERFANAVGGRRDDLSSEIENAVGANNAAGAMLDGPTGMNGFRFRGEEKTGLRPKAWMLVRYLWSARDHVADFCDLAQPVWGDHAEIVTPDKVGSARREANNFFERASWPLRVKVSEKNHRVALINKTEKK